MTKKLKNRSERERPELPGTPYLCASCRFGLIILGLIWLVYVIFCEQHYRSAITAIRLRRH